MRSSGNVHDRGIAGAATSCQTAGPYGGSPIGDVNPLRWLSAKFYSVQAIRAKINI